MTLKEAYSYAVVFLERNGIDESDFKALCTVCSILGIKNSDYEAHKDDFVQNKKQICFGNLNQGNLCSM